MGVQVVHLRYGALVAFVVATALLIAALAAPKFLTGSIPPTKTGSFTVDIGAFRFCVDVTTALASGSICYGISSSCVLSGSSGTDKSGKDLLLWEEEHCGSWNAFRGLLVTAVVLENVALLAAIAAMCWPASPRWLHGAVIAAAALAVLFATISLATFSSSVPDVDIVISETTNETFRLQKGASVWLQAIGAVATAVAVGLWIFAWRKQSLEQASLVQAEPASYGGGLAAQGQLPPPQLQQQHYYPTGPGQPQPQFYGQPAPQQQQPSPMSYATPDEQLRQPLTSS